MRLAQDHVRVYAKADRSSKVIATTPPGIREVMCLFSVGGLKDPGPYWYGGYLYPNNVAVGQPACGADPREAHASSAHGNLQPCCLSQCCLPFVEGNELRESQHQAAGDVKNVEAPSAEFF